MNDWFHIGFLTIGLIDIIDILVVAYIFYRLFILMRGTRAIHMLFGLLIIFLISAVSGWLHMRGVNWLVSNLRTVWVIASVILFQPELRRLLIYLGQSPIARIFWKVESSKMIDVVVDASFELSKRNYGALMVLQRDVGMGMILETGTQLKGEISTPMLSTIFTPRTALHDGAVIIHGEMIEAAGCTLPLSQNPDIADMGMRHKAGLGVTEETDAIAVVVSEETRQISIAVGGKYVHNLSEKLMRRILQEHFNHRSSRT